MKKKETKKLISYGNNMNKNDKKLWLELYEIAEKIEKLEPWKCLTDADVTMYLSQNYKDIFYCCVMGNAGLHKAVAIYKGRQIHKYLELSESDMINFELVNYQECLICNFLTEEETLPCNIELTKKLGIKFKKSYISFENFEKGYEPSCIDIEQVKMLIETMQNFYAIFKDIVEKKLKVNFDENESVARYYDEEENKFVNAIELFQVPVITYKTLKLDKKIKDKLSKAKKGKAVLEFDFLNYLPIRIDDLQVGDRLAYPRTRFMADEESGLILLNDLIKMSDYKSEDDYLEESLNVLVNFILENGKPKKIYVRDRETQEFLSDFATSTGVKVVISPRFEIIDSVYSMFFSDFPYEDEE